MNLGVWMSRAVWQHKREGVERSQVWNLRQLPAGLTGRKATARLYVAIRGCWRGYFQFHAFLFNPSDSDCPFALVFDPRSWTSIPPTQAPPQDRRSGYTLDVPGARPRTGRRTRQSPCVRKTEGTRRSNETANETKERYR